MAQTSVETISLPILTGATQTQLPTAGTMAGECFRRQGKTNPVLKHLVLAGVTIKVEV